jgi:hypothetical protein
MLGSATQLGVCHSERSAYLVLEDRTWDRTMPKSVREGRDMRFAQDDKANLVGFLDTFSLANHSE